MKINQHSTDTCHLITTTNFDQFYSDVTPPVCQSCSGNIPYSPKRKLSRSDSQCFATVPCDWARGTATRNCGDAIELIIHTQLLARLVVCFVFANVEG